MKLHIFLILFLVPGINASAQLSSNLILNSRPPANLSEWAITRGTLTLIITNQQAPRKAKIRTTIKTVDGTEVSVTDMNLAKVFIFTDGNTILNAAEVFPLEIQKFSGKYGNSLNRSGKLPSDNYQFCVELVEETTFAPLTPGKCRPFFVAGLQLPILMMPVNEQELDLVKAQTAIMFRWTPLTPRPNFAVNYRLQVFEILANQQAVQALRSNQPLLDKIITGQTQYIWNPQLGLMNSAVDSLAPRAAQSNRFVWTVQSLDGSLTPVGVDANYEGRSEPIQFTVADRDKNLRITADKKIVK